MRFSKWNSSSDVSFLESMSHLEPVYGTAAAAVPPDALMVGFTLVQGAPAKGAVCLDGNHLHRGFGTGANSWLIQLEGGGWCNTLRSCIYRKTTHRGSSTLFEKQIPFTGILSNKSEENPDFFNWNRVKIRYCDGASFAGDSENKEAGLQFRGKRIWLAAREDLMSKGMHNANQVFTDVSGGHTLRSFFAGVVCLQCFFPQNLIAGIKTPLFILNAAYDSWQVQESLAPSTADPQGSWHDCKLNNERCSASQIQFLQGKMSLFHAFKASLVLID
ncbi:hypothetical protein SASPL_150586 [Salvia splendens]|uniref:Pectin acetylesterase n=1 Tax=Salvia splendens TaxID=180675 RepID=A0A8X8Z1W0_SALSN|nr:hypothetical protein SASPL_150586 [Salvia splendens]